MYNLYFGDSRTVLDCSHHDYWLHCVLLGLYDWYKRHLHEAERTWNRLNSELHWFCAHCDGNRYRLFFAAKQLFAAVTYVTFNIFCEKYVKLNIIH